MNAELARWLEERKPSFEGFLSELFQDAWPAEFGEMCRYPLLTGGKRMRPMWVMASYQAASDDPTQPESLLHVAAALELIHCYSLVHDDLPCMDDDDYRRGQPTAHKAFGEGPAVLIGDALLTHAFGLALGAPNLSDATRVAIGKELAHIAGYRGMIGGQAADVGLAGPIDTEEALTRLHRGKTGALIRGACRLGGLVAGVTNDELKALSLHGESIGLAFQLADDVLDAEEDAGEEGPPSFVKLMGLERCQETAEELYQKSLSSLACFGESASALHWLAHYTVRRDI